MTLHPLSPADRLKPFFKLIDHYPAIARLLPLVWILLVGGIAFLWGLGEFGLVDETEPLFAEAARQMTVTGDWLTPYFNGETRFDKPPLIYWLMAIAYQTLGVNEWAVRLPSALSAIALTGFVFYTLQAFGFATPAAAQPAAAHPQVDEKLLVSDSLLQRRLAAWIGAGAIALNLQMLAWGRTGVSDMLLTGCMGSALLAFFWGYAQPQYPRRQLGWYLAFYVLCALAVLTKGPVGIVLPVLIIGAFLLYSGQFWQVLRELRLIWGGLLFLALTLPWYVLIIQEHGQTYIANFFGYHNFERFTSVVNRHSAPWYFYFLVVLVGCIPWSIFLPLAIARLRFWRRAAWQQQPRSAQLGIFAFIWFAVVFGFFSISVTKLPSYTIPLLPAAAVLLALLWSDQMMRSTPHRGLVVSGGINVLFLMLLAGVVFVGGQWLGDDPDMPELPERVRQSGILLWGGSIWLMTAIAGALLLWRRQAQWQWATNVLGFVAFLGITLLPLLGLADDMRQLPLRTLSETILREQQPAEEIVMVGFKKPSLVFYTQQPITYIYSPNKAIAHLRDRMQERQSSPSSDGTAQAGDGRTALMIGRITFLEQEGQRLPRYDVIDEAGTYRLIRIRFRRERKK